MNRTSRKGLDILQGKTKNLSKEKFEFVRELYIVKAMRYVDVCAAFAKEFGDTERSARGYITKVKKALQNTQDDKLGYHMQSALIRLNDLYNKAYEAEKWSDCKDIQKEINKLTGVDVKRVEINQNINNKTLDVNKLINQLPPEMIARMVEGMNLGQKTIDITPDEE